ncbi:MAG: DUF692 family multinuclear iron-containing protein [Brevefilum sp.]
MKFAVNYSTPLCQLLEEGAVDIDLIKCPDWEGMIAEAERLGPVTLHYDLKAGLGKTFEVDFSRIKRLKEHTYTPHVNTHLVTPDDFDPDNPEALAEINQLWREEINLMTAHLGEGCVALEHYPYTEATPNILPAANRSTFSQVILDTNCMLLLDLSHAKITCHSLGINVRDYIEALPVDRLVELHVTGVRWHNGILTDHFQMMREDWDLFEWALGEIRSGHWREPEIVAFEYGGVGGVFVWRTDYDFLKQQIPILYEMVHQKD